MRSASKQCRRQWSTRDTPGARAPRSSSRGSSCRKRSGRPRLCRSASPRAPQGRGPACARPSSLDRGPSNWRSAAQTISSPAGRFAVARADAPDQFFLREVANEAAVRIQIPQGVESRNKIAGISESVEGGLSHARHDAHLGDNILAIGNLDAHLTERRIDRSQNVGHHVHRVAFHRTVKKGGEAFSAVLGSHPIVGGTCVILLTLADVGEAFGAGHVVRVTSVEIAVAIGFLTELDELAVAEHVVCQPIVLRLRAVAPDDPGRLGQTRRFLTQLSSGVDTGPPRISRGERHSGNGLSAFGMVSQGAVTTENSRLRREELQGESRGGRSSSARARCYNSNQMYARKLQVEIVVGAQRRATPLDWLDSFCMRNFTGSAEFDDTLPTGEGQIEAGLGVDPERLAAAMSEWFTKRGKGEGQPVRVEIREMS